MSVKARCLNYTGCLLAYRGEVIELAQSAPLVCPECGKTVNVTQSSVGGFGRMLVTVLVVAALAAGGYFAYKKFKGNFAGKPKDQEETTDVTPVTPPIDSGDPAPPGTGATPSAASGGTTAPPSTPAKIDLNPSKAENARVRDEVLKRIDDIPKLSQPNKDKLYNSVQRARSMGLIISIPFTSGGSKLPASEIPKLKEQLEKPEIAKLRSDPTYVFVVLGYADPKGDEKKNLAISRARAESVLDVMHEKCGVDNVMHAVAMGGSKLLDSDNLEKNRVVEVWAVLP